MRVKILEESLRSVCRETGQRYNLSRDDVVTVADSTGAHWCAMGWAEDVAGEVETGERTPGAVRVAPDSTRHLTTQS